MLTPWILSWLTALGGNSVGSPSFLYSWWAWDIYPRDLHKHFHATNLCLIGSELLEWNVILDLLLQLELHWWGCYVCCRPLLIYLSIRWHTCSLPRQLEAMLCWVLHFMVWELCQQLNTIVWGDPSTLEPCYLLVPCFDWVLTWSLLLEPLLLDFLMVFNMWLRYSVAQNL